MRRAVSPVVASIFLIAIGIVLSLFVSNLYRETSFANVKVEAIEYAYIYVANNAGVENARWKIVLYVVNRGTQSLMLTDVYVNAVEVDVYGMVHGESLVDGSLIGVSLPGGGLILGPGEGVELFIWVGELLYSPGTQLVVSLNPINNVTQNKTIKLP